jgi:GAF domain-containing protein
MACSHRKPPRTISFCTHAIRGGEPFIVLDAGQDERFQGNPLVTGDPHIRFYAGAPLKTNTDQRIGTVCVIDRESRRDFDHVDRRRLEDMAAEVMEEFEHRRRRLVRIERSCPR